MKLLLEVLISVFLHPLAFVLCLVNLSGRTDMSGSKKFLWGVITIFWGIGPILYVVLADGALW